MDVGYAVPTSSEEWTTVKRPIVLGLAIASAFLALAGVVGAVGDNPRQQAGISSDFECKDCSG
jgi:hypothetical protein